MIVHIVCHCIQPSSSQCTPRHIFAFLMFLSTGMFHSLHVESKEPVRNEEGEGFNKIDSPLRYRYHQQLQ